MFIYAIYIGITLLIIKHIYSRSAEIKSWDKSETEAFLLLPCIIFALMTGHVCADLTSLLNSVSSETEITVKIAGGGIGFAIGYIAIRFLALSLKKNNDELEKENIFEPTKFNQKSSEVSKTNLPLLKDSSIEIKMICAIEIALSIVKIDSSEILEEEKSKILNAIKMELSKYENETTEAIINDDISEIVTQIDVNDENVSYVKIANSCKKLSTYQDKNFNSFVYQLAMDLIIVPDSSRDEIYMAVKYIEETLRIDPNLAHTIRSNCNWDYKLYSMKIEYLGMDASIVNFRSLNLETKEEDLYSIAKLKLESSPKEKNKQTEQAKPMPDSQIKNEYWPSGAKKSESEMKNVKQNGKRYEWFENGALNAEMEFKDDKLTGKGSTWYSNGAMKSESEWKNGVLNGKYTVWAENGDVLNWGLFTNGELNNEAMLKLSQWTELFETVKTSNQLDLNSNIAIAKKALGIAEMIYEFAQLEIAMTLRILSILHSKGRDYFNAEAFCKRSLIIYENELGAKDIEVAATLSILGEIYVDKCENQFVPGKDLSHKDKSLYLLAEPLFIRALEIGENYYGVKHLYLTGILNNLGRLHYGMGQLENSESFFERHLLIAKSEYGENDNQVGLLLANLALVNIEQGKFNQAEQKLTLALEINENALGEINPDKGGILLKLGLLFEKQGKWEKALDFQIKGEKANYSFK